MEKQQNKFKKKNKTITYPIHQTIRYYYIINTTTIKFKFYTTLLCGRVKIKKTRIKKYFEFHFFCLIITKKVKYNINLYYFYS